MITIQEILCGICWTITYISLFDVGILITLMKHGYLDFKS